MEDLFVFPVKEDVAFPFVSKFCGSDTDGIFLLPGFAQHRHSRHVLTIGLIKDKRASSKPAADKIVRMVGSEACHQRKCSLRSSVVTTLGL